MKGNLIAAFVVAVIVSGLFMLWNQYGDRIRTDNHRPDSTRLLDRFEEQGVDDFAAKDINGNEVKLSQFKGKVIILNFWASWCDPCVEEFPSMLKLLNAYKDDLVMVAVSADYTLEELNKFLKAFNTKNEVSDDQLIVIWDKDKKIAENWQLDALPESFIIGKDFKLRRKVSGSERWASKDAFEYFKMLAENPKK